MLTLITCDVEIKNSKTNLKDTDNFAFKNNKELNTFLKNQFKKEKSIHLYGSKIIDSFAEVTKELKESFRVKRTFSFIQRKNDQTIIYSIKENNYRTLNERKPTKDIGSSWTVSYRKRKIIITWQSVDNFRLEIKEAIGGSTSWHHKSYRAALSTAKKEIDQSIKFNRSYRPAKTKVSTIETPTVKSPPKAKANFKKGQSVEKQYIFQGQVTDREIRKVHSVSKGIVYLEDDYGDKVTASTYNQAGKEQEEFFLPHSWTKIVVTEKTK